MPSQASIPGKAHKAGWTAQQPYVTPNDPMPRRFTEQTDDVPQDQRPRPIAFDYETPKNNPNEAPVPTGTNAQPMKNEMHIGKYPKQPGAPSAKPQSAVKRAR